jgi:hypothetical protein
VLPLCGSVTGFATRSVEDGIPTRSVGTRSPVVSNNRRQLSTRSCRYSLVFYDVEEGTVLIIQILSKQDSIDYLGGSL